MPPKIAILDIETAPAVVEAWGLRKQYISIDQIREPGMVLGFGVKWRGSRRTEWFGLDSLEVSDLALAAQDWLDVADIVVTYNGDSFDLPILEREILLAGLNPPTPYKSVDLWKTTRNLRFLSSKLDFVAQQLGISRKMSTGGYELWKRCMAGDPAAFAIMARYCKQDVRVTEEALEKLLTRIKGWPNISLWNENESGEPNCPRCGSYDLVKNGKAPTVAVVYQRYRCRHCGGNVRGVKAISKATSETRAV